MSRQDSAREWLRIIAPRDNASLPFAAEQLYAAIHAGMGRDDRTHLLLIGVHREVGIYLGVERARVGPVVALLRATYPDVEVAESAPPLEGHLSNPVVVDGARWQLANHPAYPVKTVREFTDCEPMAMTLGALAEAHLGELGVLSILLRPAPMSFHRRAAEHANTLAVGGDTSPLWVRRVDAPLRFLGDALSGILAAGPSAGPAVERQQARTMDVQVKLAAIQAKSSRPAFSATVRTAWLAPCPERAKAGHAGLVSALGQFTVTGQNQFVPNNTEKRSQVWQSVCAADPTRRERTVLGSSELAGLVHLPGPELVTPHLARTGARRREQRHSFDPAAPGTLVLGETLHRGGGEYVGLAVADLMTHAYVIGPSGTGKTTLLTRLVLELARSGTAAAVLDPHGDLTRQVLGQVPFELLDRFSLFDLADIDNLPSLNPLWVPPDPPGGLVMARAIRSAAVTACFADLWGLHRATTPNLLHFLEAAVASLVATGRGCLADLPTFLTDPRWRQVLLTDLGDARLSARWKEFSALAHDDRARTIRSILNKAADFDRNPILGTVFGDPGPGLQLADVMDHGRILLVSLPRGLVPEGTVELVGALLVTLVYQAALARESRPPQQRPPVVAVIDEFQEFGLTAFAHVVTAARKYGLGLVVANQNLSRIQAVNPEVLATLLANIGTLIAFRLAPADAAVLAPQLAPFDAADLLALAPYEAYLRLPSATGPHVVAARALPPPPEPRDDAAVAALARHLRLPGHALRASAGAKGSYVLASNQWGRL